MECDYELVKATDIKPGNWIRVRPGKLNVVVKLMPNGDDLLMADLGIDGEAYSSYWNRNRTTLVTRIKKPALYFQSVGPVLERHSDWSFPLAFTPEGPVLLMKPHNDGSSYKVFLNLETASNGTSQPTDCAPVLAFKVWSSEQAKLANEDPLIHYQG